MKYPYDPKKLAQSVAKHGVWFDMEEGFGWENAIVRIDDRNDYPKNAVCRDGPDWKPPYAMVFCLRETAVRIISLRKANRREVREYENQV